MTNVLRQYLALLIIIISIPLHSQNITGNNKEYIKKLNLAEGFFIYDQDYLNASKIYKELFERDSTNHNLAYKLGVCYLNIKGSERLSLDLLSFAAENYTNDINYSASGSMAPFDVIYYLAFSCQINMELEKAIDYYEKYKKNLGTKEAIEIEYVSNQIRACKNTIEATKDGIMLKRRLFTPWMESYQNAINPVISSNDSVFMFTQKADEVCLVFCSRKSGSDWPEPQNITSQLGKYPDMYTNSLTADGNTLIIARNDGFKGNLYISTYANGKWSRLSKLGKNINSKYWESHGCITPDGLGLYFSSNRPGGEGSLDIYYSERTNKREFGPAINLGKPVNTRLEENTPCFDFASQLLYFSSTGHEGFGGYDIFVSRKGKLWSEPLHLPFPLNTTSDNLHFFPYQSNKSGLYSVYPDEVSDYSTIYYLTHGIEAEIENIGIAGNITLGDGMDINSDSLIIEFFTGFGLEPIEKIKQKEPGIFDHEMKIKKYKVFISYPGYKPDTILIDIPENFTADNIKINRQLVPNNVESGKFLSVNNILFDFDSFILNRGAELELEKIIPVLLQYTDLEIEVIGYTDPIGSMDYNLQLSKKRANTVKDYLVKSGVSKNRLIPVALGEGSYIATNTLPDGSDNPEGRKYNRRVNLSIRNQDYNISFGSSRFVPRHLRARTAPGFFVVLLESDTRLKPSNNELRKIYEISLIKEDTTDGVFKYYVGEFLNKSDAYSYLNTARDAGYNKAYLSTEYEIGNVNKKSGPQLTSYTIQLHALRNPTKKNKTILTNITVYKGKDGFYRYVTGEYYGYSNASKALKKIYNMGYKQAFIKELVLLKQQSISE